MLDKMVVLLVFCETNFVEFTKLEKSTNFMHGPQYPMIRIYL